RVAMEHLVTALPEPSQKFVPEDCQEPRPAIGTGIEAVKPAKGSQVCLLDEVLRLGAVVGEPEGTAVQGVDVDERRVFELAATGPRPHPLEHSNRSCHPKPMSIGQYSTTEPARRPEQLRPPVTGIFSSRAGLVAQDQPGHHPHLS